MKLLWLDLETTGLDETADRIIEVGCVLTDAKMDIEYSALQSGVRPSLAAYERLWRNDVVREMHIKNGLLGELFTAPGAFEVEARLLTWLEKHLGREDVMLAGSGVAAFDRRFLKAQWPDLESRLVYSMLDVGVLRRACRMWTGASLTSVNDDKTHRAMDDVRCHLEEARSYRDFFQRHAGLKTL